MHDQALLIWRYAFFVLNLGLDIIDGVPGLHVQIESPSILKLLPHKDQALLIWRNVFFVLSLGFDTIDGITGLHVECDGLASQSLDEDLQASTQAEHQVQRGSFWMI